MTTATPGWCALATDPTTAPTLGISGSVIDSHGAAFFFGIVGDVTGPIVWNLQWTPVEPVAGPAPYVADWDGVLAYAAGSAGPWPTGTAILTAKMDGVEIPGYLRLVFSAGGYGSYGSAAWDAPGLGTGPGWNVPIMGSGNPVPGSTGTLDRYVDPEFGLAYGAGIAGEITGAVVWSSSWTPIDDGPGPSLTFPGPALVVVTLPPRGGLSVYGGTLVLTATMGGVGFDHALRMAITEGGFGGYGVLAWDETPLEVDHGGGDTSSSWPGVAGYPSELPGPKTWQETPAERRAGSGLRESGQWRPRSREYHAEASAEWIYSVAEMAIWKDWFEASALDGLAWVVMRSPGVGGLALRLMRYQDGTVKRTNLGRGLYAVSATMELAAPAPRS